MFPVFASDWYGGLIIKQCCIMDWHTECTLYTLEISRRTGCRSTYDFQSSVSQFFFPLVDGISKHLWYKKCMKSLLIKHVILIKCKKNGELPGTNLFHYSLINTNTSTECCLCTYRGKKSCSNIDNNIKRKQIG